VSVDQVSADVGARDIEAHYVEKVVSVDQVSADVGAASVARPDVGCKIMCLSIRSVLTSAPCFGSGFRKKGIEVSVDQVSADVGARERRQRTEKHRVSVDQVSADVGAKNHDRAKI